MRPAPQPTFMEAAQQSLPSPVFTVALKPNNQGMLNFGYVDDSLYKGDLVSAPVDASQASWRVNAVTLSAGSASITQSMVFGKITSSSTSYTEADRIPDTAASDTMWADSGFVLNFWNQVQGATQQNGYWVFPCSSWIPNMDVSVGGHSHGILGTTFNSGQIADGTSHVFSICSK